MGHGLLLGRTSKSLEVHALIEHVRYLPEEKRAELAADLFVSSSQGEPPFPSLMLLCPGNVQIENCSRQGWYNPEDIRTKRLLALHPDPEISEGQIDVDYDGHNNVTWARGSSGPSYEVYPLGEPPCLQTNESKRPFSLFAFGQYFRGNHVARVEYFLEEDDFRRLVDDKMVLTGESALVEKVRGDCSGFPGKEFAEDLERFVSGQFIRPEVTPYRHELIFSSGKDKEPLHISPYGPSIMEMPVLDNGFEGDTRWFVVLQPDWKMSVEFPKGER